ncbi:hypothetical protein B0H14DRAFT_2944948 [Mycena olivaceomarginata]|nr:hypothetical protein B0H14DRAFT_2944948 [Mycena olivaceomarginata]
MRARPVGIHRHFHILNIRNGIWKDTGHAVSVDAVWHKLRGLYDMDALEAIDLEIDGYESRHSETSTPFALPYDPKVEELVAQRRVRLSQSPISPPRSPSPAHSPPARTRAGRHAKRGKSKLDLRRKVATRASCPPPRATASPSQMGGTEYGDDDAEMRDVSPGACIRRALAHANCPQMRV